jgi:hypothetical protein
MQCDGTLKHEVLDKSDGDSANAIMVEFLVFRAEGDLAGSGCLVVSVWFFSATKYPMIAGS